MRRLLAWGRQDPQCPAEAASPPPLSAFHSPCSVLPPPSKLFSDIERQLSARIAAEPQVRSAQAQPSSPTEAANERTSPAGSTPVHPPAATDAVSVQQSGANADFQQQRQQNTATNVPSVHQPEQQPKAIDAFFAALANANGKGTGGATSSALATGSFPCQQQQQQMPLLETEEPNSRRNSFAQQSPILARLSSVDLCVQRQQHFSQHPFSSQPLANKVQQVTNSELAANLLVTALAQQKPSLGLLANLRASDQTTSAHHPLPLNQLNIPLANSQSSSIEESMALNAFQAQFDQQKMAAEQRDFISAATMALKAPLSPQNAVFANSEVGFPALLNRLSSVPTIFGSVVPGPSQSKPIPLLDERVDLLQFKRKEPREWSSDDVVAWILDVARRHRIPCENLNLAKFANCTGPLLMLMNEQSFKENDLSYGSLLFSEFCKLVTDENFIDEWMKVNGAVNGGPSSASNQPTLAAQIDLKKTATFPPAVSTTFLQQTAMLGQLALQQEKCQQQRLLLAKSVTGVDQQPMGTMASVSAGTSNNLLLNAVVAAANSQQEQQKNAAAACSNYALPSRNQSLFPAPSAAPEGIFQQQQDKQKVAPAPAVSLQSLADQSAIASLSLMAEPMQREQPQQEALAISGRTGTTLIDQQRTQQYILKPNANERLKRGVGRPVGSKNKVEKQIKRNKDGRPRKRSQHTKGNKLWEFIRDALKDPRTCPSIVRWEDPTEGVFRIVESERLAILWGQKKNNQKMTYEKLSRAMRTYYEKEILVPVPKSGLYPKKLVYKFGPTAHGWRAAASLAVQARLALIVGPSVRM